MSAEERARDRIAAAVATNRERDAIDRAQGFASPTEASLEAELRTVLAAIWCGLQLEDWDAVAEGAAMLAAAIDYRPWDEP